jgi:hypothetical protein
MFSLSRNFLKFAAASTLFALTTGITPASAYEMTQKSGPVPAHEPILTTVGNKHVIAFFVPGDGQCNVQVVTWNADDMEANSAGGVRLSLNAGQSASIDSSETESFTLKCGDHAETLASVQQFASK